LKNVQQPKKNSTFHVFIDFPHSISTQTGPSSGDFSEKRKFMLKNEHKNINFLKNVKKTLNNLKT